MTSAPGSRDPMVTCKMGVVFGPAQIGKTLTLEAIEGDQAFGAPVLIRVDESKTRPFARAHLKQIDGYAPSTP